MNQTEEMRKSLPSRSLHFHHYNPDNFLLEITTHYVNINSTQKVRKNCYSPNRNGNRHLPLLLF